MISLLIVIAILAALEGCSTRYASDASRLPSNYSWKDQRDNNLTKQGFDYSCGAAALSTYMTYYFNDHISEKDLLADMLNHTPQEKFTQKQRDGLSMLDLKQAAERRGYKAYGVKLRLTTITNLKAPVLVYLETAEFKHFAVLRGVIEDRVYLADPSRGNIRLPVYRFQQEWPGIALILTKQGHGVPDKHGLSLHETLPLRHEIQGIGNALRM